jgi:hypothetical protein
MDEQTINAIYQAYVSGAMTPEDAAEYEADVQSGKMTLPQGATLQQESAPVAATPESQTIQPVNQSQVETAPMLNQGIVDAYQNGQMTRDDMMQLERDVAEGKWLLPEGVQLQTTKSMGFFERVGEMVTGEERSTPEIEALPDWGGMPEMNSFSMASFKSALGTLITDPAETVQILKANFPGIDVRRDSKGNFIMKSSLDGQEYAIKPGFRVSDIPRAGSGIAAFTPAGRAVTLPGQIGGAAATQAVIEGSQVATGGEFDPEQIPLAGLAGGGGYLVGKGLQAGGQTLGRAYERFMRAPKPAPRVEPTIGVTPKQPSPMGAMPEGAEAMTTGELGATARKAAEGGVGATQAQRVLAEQAMPDPKVIEAAQRLGVDEYLQPDHVSTNQAFRELSQAVKSVPGSQARTAELQGYQAIGQRADDIIDELGGLTDLSQIDATVKTRLSQVQTQLDDAAEKLYKQVNEAIPPKTDAPANNLITFLERQADELGGEEFFSAQERALLKQLRPRPVLNEAGEQIGEEMPTYARLDRIRKDLTSARVKGEGPFKDANSGMIKRLERELLKDQQTIADQMGVLDTFNLARQTVAMRKGVESDMASLFGKNLDRTILKTLDTSVKKIQTGDVSGFVNLVKAIPEDIRKDVVASGLASAFGKNARNGQLNFTSYANWYEGLLANKKAHAALMANLPPEARKRLSDLYRVSNGIRQASKERITTGRLQVVAEEIRGADTLLGNIYDTAKRASMGGAAEVITSAVGLPGAGLASGITAALVKGKPNAMKAADELVTSPEFIEMAKSGSEEAAKKFVKTPVFKRFYNAIGGERAMSLPEQWVLSAFQTERQMTRESE